MTVNRTGNDDSYCQAEVGGCLRAEGQPGPQSKIVKNNQPNTERRKEEKKKRCSPIKTPRNLRLQRPDSLWQVDPKSPPVSLLGFSPPCSVGLVVSADSCSKLLLPLSSLLCEAASERRAGWSEHQGLVGRELNKSLVLQALGGGVSIYRILGSH